MRITLILAAALALAACTTAQQTAATSAGSTVAATLPVPTGTAATIVTDGQLFCANKGLIVALATAAGQPVIAKGASSSYVADACAIIGAVPVPPPAPGTAVPTTVVTPPDA